MMLNILSNENNSRISERYSIVKIVKFNKIAENQTVDIEEKMIAYVQLN